MSEPKPAVPNDLSPGAALEALGEVAHFLGAGLSIDEALAGVAGVIERRLGALDCGIWLRTPTGGGFRVVQPVPDRPEPEHARDVAAWVTRGESPEWTTRNPRVRVPLIHDGEHLGLLGCTVPEGPAAALQRQTVVTIANILAPLLSSIELSEDLATEVALRTREIDAQRRFTARIIDSLPVGLYVIDREYRIQAWNRKRETGTQGISRDDVLGRTVFEILHRQPRDLLQQEFDQVFKTGRIEEVEVATHTGGEPHYYRITKIPMRVEGDEVTHVITIGEDITQSRLVQQQISQTEKLAAMGQLAAGVMHEINNPLATIGACIEALTGRLPSLAPAVRQNFREYLGIIDSEVERCKSIVDGLLDFSRPKSRAKTEADPNQLVEDALYLVKYHERFNKIRVLREFAEGLPRIPANAEQLIQVFLDLMLNAVDAMDGDGTLTVRTLRNPDRADEVMVEIQDTGMGIPREDVAKIFEPFFTTKAPGRGTGLGLSISYSIVAHHRGRILVDSQIGSGSTFRVILPTTSQRDVA